MEQLFGYCLTHEAIKKWPEGEEWYAMAASKDPDTIYFHQAIKEPAETNLSNEE